MKQVLTIFKKDAHHLWPEILLHLAILVGFVTAEVACWPSHRTDSFREADSLRLLMNFLLPLSWWFPIARAVQDEPLVGDRAFWVTRPFGWKRILAAKIAFLGVFLALPLFIAKAMLIHLAGISWLANVPMLLASTIMTAVLIFLPLFAVAAVTANLVRMFFVVLVFFVSTGFAVYLSSLFPYPVIFGSDTALFWIVPLAICTCVCVILLQYARRRTAVTRTLLIVLCLTITVSVSISQHTWTPNRSYKNLSSGEPSPFVLVINPDRSLLGPPPKYDQYFQPKAGQLDPAEIEEIEERRFHGQIGIPILINDVAPNRAVRVDNLSIFYRDPDTGKTVTNQHPTGQTYFAGKFPEAIDFNFDSDTYERLQDKPLTIELTVAVTEFGMIGSASSTTKSSTFAVPNGGVCHPFYEYKPYPFNDCQFAAEQLPRTRVRAYWSNQPCGQPSSSGDEGMGWIGHDEPSGWSLDFDPVEEVPVYLSNRRQPYGLGEVSVCPGTSVQFDNFQVTRRRLLHFILPPILPRDYTRRQQSNLPGEGMQQRFSRGPFR
jgi:hypothetical protein